MSAYIIASVVVTNPTQYEQYRALAGVAGAKHGAQYLVRGGDMTVLEGQFPGPRMVVLRFDSTAKARAFYDSPEYTLARQAREGAAVMNMVLVEGAD
jgi:uncharacterized protein (DUF1330 family)